MSLSKEQIEFVKDTNLLISYASKIGVELTFGEAYRTKEQQEIYLKNGKSRTMKSNHLKRLAIDFNFFIDNQLFWEHEKITKLGEFWESLNSNNRWGGNFKNFKDRPHFERNI